MSSLSRGGESIGQASTEVNCRRVTLTRGTRLDGLIGSRVKKAAGGYFGTLKFDPPPKRLNAAPVTGVSLW